MTLSQYRSSSSWLGAIELGPKLMALAEELPASEEMGLSLQLRQLMVEMPTTVSADLVRGTDTRQVVALRLLATLELVDRVYPALDTAGLRTEADKLVERLMSPEQFAAGPEPVAAHPAHAEPTHAEPATAEHPAEDLAPDETPEPAEKPAVEPTEAHAAAVHAPEAHPPAAPAATPVVPGEVVVQPDGSIGEPTSLIPGAAPATSVPISSEPTP